MIKNMSESSNMQDLISDNKLLQIINSIINYATKADMHNLSITNNFEYRKQLTDRYNDFAISYPSLFNTVIDDPKHFDMKRLKQMLEMRQKIKNNNISYEEASTQIGQQYYDEFAKPIIDKLSK